MRDGRWTMDAEPRRMADVAGLRSYLLAGRNADGGWGYVRGKGSRLEPTCFALLALGDARMAGASLSSWPVHDGLLLERPGGEPNYGFHAIGLLTLAAAGAEHQAGNQVLLSALQRAAGIRVAPSTVNRQDNRLQGWGWFADEFSWAEPTAWGVLALKRARQLGWQIEQSRLDESQSVLFDRVCGAGGWNYGSSNMLGTELTPYVPTTAVALLALQDQRSTDAVGRSVNFLESHATWESSGYALGLAGVALRAYARDVTEVQRALHRQLSVTIDLGQQLGIAMAVLAFDPEKADAAFRF